MEPVSFRLRDSFFEVGMLGGRFDIEDAPDLTLGCVLVTLRARYEVQRRSRFSLDLDIAGPQLALHPRKVRMFGDSSLTVDAVYRFGLFRAPVAAQRAGRPTVGHLLH